MTSLQVCMDSSDWFQQGMYSSPITPQSDQEDILTCTRTLLERRVIRPQHEQALKCPRCESTHTKFCYYNNYSLSQPRYFCKACRRYWTKGGTLRNIPVGGRCRKNKKSSAKKSSSDNQSLQQTQGAAALSPSPLPSYYHDHNVDPMDQFQLTFPDQIHFPSLHSNGILTANMNPHHSTFLLDNPAPVPHFLENKCESLFGGRDFMGVDGENFGEINDNFGGLCYRTGIDQNLSAGMQLQYENHHELDAKPMNTSNILSLEWHNLQQEACNSEIGMGYPGGINGSSWIGLMNAFGSSVNPML